jgi:hypothetical protein
MGVDEETARLVEYAKLAVGREHGIPESDARRLVGSTIGELHSDAKALARELNLHDPSERDRDEGGRYRGRENVGVNEAIRRAAGR